MNIVDLVLEGYSAKFIDTALKHGIDKDRQDDEGQTALMHACSLGKKKIVEVLIKNGAAIDVEDSEGNDVWYHASLSDKEAILELLRNYDELSAPNHAPKDLIKILSNFTIDKPIKYTTHTWDFGGLQKEYSDFNGFIKKVNSQRETFEEELEELSPSIHRKIYNFLLNKDPKSQGWLAKDNISIGWSSLDGLEKWCNDGNNPFDFKLSTSFIVNKREIARFGDVINLFKQEIEIRKEYHMLQNFFMDIQENMSDFYSIETAKLNNKNFYADVESFRIALHKIFSEIQKREFAEIKVEAVDTTGEYIDIKIIQVGSFSLNSEAEMLKEVEDGDFADIKKLLTNLCDWSIESSFQNESYRINYLKSDKKTLELEQLDYQPKGFTHRLRFYKK